MSIVHHLKVIKVDGLVLMDRRRPEDEWEQTVNARAWLRFSLCLFGGETCKMWTAFPPGFKHYLSHSSFVGLNLISFYRFSCP